MVASLETAAEFEAAVDEEMDEQAPEVEAAVTETAPGETEYTKREQEHYHAIVEEQKKVARLRWAMDEAHEDYKSAKKRFEAAQDGLDALIARGADPQRPLPFAEEAKADEPANVDTAWMLVEVSTLGLPEKLVEKLTEAGLTTIGKVADFTGSGNDLTDIKGIGPGNAEKINEALDAFWQEHPEFTAPAVEAESEDTNTAERDSC